MSPTVWMARHGLFQDYAGGMGDKYVNVQILGRGRQCVGGGVSAK